MKEGRGGGGVGSLTVQLFLLLTHSPFLPHHSLEAHWQGTAANMTHERSSSPGPPPLTPLPTLVISNFI